MTYAWMLCYPLQSVVIWGIDNATHAPDTMSRSLQGHRRSVTRWRVTERVLTHRCKRTSIGMVKSSNDYTSLCLDLTQGIFKIFKSVFPHPMFVPRIKRDYSYRLYHHINPHSCKIGAFKFLISLVVSGQLVILSDRAMHLMTSNPDYIPLVDIIQGHFHKSFDFAFRITDWTCFHGPHLHATCILRIISRGVSGLATDSPCGVWGRGWTTCLLHESPLFGSHFKMRVGM